jgi:hypothetical protein
MWVYATAAQVPSSPRHSNVINPAGVLMWGTCADYCQKRFIDVKVKVSLC